ncbi:hypothetical protein DRP77_11335 [Candidatus Poribacteria bacterium]|nr:MAG: hypothetical protein DRP77_11335 [Candidatus Poribacteria bacterium]
MAFETIFAWYNLPFIALLLMVAAYLTLHLLGSDSPSSMDLGDLAVSVDDEEGDEISKHRVLAGVLRGLGIEGVPLTMLLGVFVISLCFEGLALNIALRRGFEGYRPFFFPAVLGASAVISLGVVKLFALAIRTITPSSAESRPSYRSLVGRTARVVIPTDKGVGKARLVDGEGNLIDVYFRVKEGGERPEEGDEILLVEFDPSERLFEAEKFSINQNGSEG